MTTIAFPDAPARIQAAIDAGILKGGDWGDGTHAVCMMSAIISGADNTEACVTAGWPEWLVSLSISLFDAEVGADDEERARAQFALDLTRAASKPFDPDHALDLFLLARLETGAHSALKSLRLNPVDADWWLDCEAAIQRVCDLIRRRLAGEDVAEEMKAAADAAYAARAAAYAAADAADAAAYAAYAAAYAAADAADAAYAAAYAARAAAYAARAAAYAAADAAAYAAARADLIAAVTAVQEGGAA